MKHRSTQLVHAVACLMALVAIALGPPLLLASFAGWPLPTALPTAAELEQGLGGGVPDATIFKGLACIAWLAWLQIIIALIVDVAAVARGGITARAPLLPGVQIVVGRLVAGATVLVSLLAPAPRLAGALPSPATPAAVAQPISPISPAPPATPRTSSAPTTADSGKTWTVVRHDSYWSIAERTLGDGLRWREIRDLNTGRTMPDGQIVTADGDTIHPGWVLQLPADAARSASSHPVTAVQTAGPQTVVADSGDSLWSIAEEHADDLHRPEASDAEVTDYWADLVTANPQLADPNLVHVGQPITLPATGGAPLADVPPPAVPPEPAPHPSPQEPASEPASDLAAEDEVEVGTLGQAQTGHEAQPATDRASMGSSEAAPSTQTGDDQTTTTVAVGLLGVAGAGIAVGAARAVRRRRRTRHHRPDRAATRTPAEARDTHRAVLASAIHAEDAVDQLRAELDALAVEVAAHGQRCRPRIVQFDTDHIEILLDDAAVPAPTGWRAQGSGAAWVKDRSETLVADGSECFAAPLLVTIGQPDDGGQLHLDLETEGLLSIVGDDEAVDGLVRSWLTELATTAMAENLWIHVVGNAVPDDLDHYERVQRFATWDHVIADLRARSSEISDLLAVNQWPNTFAARGAGCDHIGLAPLAVIGTAPDNLSDLQQLHDNGFGAFAVALIAPDEVIGTEVRCEGSGLSLPAIGLECTIQTLSSEAAGALAALVTEDEDYPAPDPAVADAPRLAQDSPEPSAAAGPCCDPEYDVLVRFLGDIEVIGASEPIKGRPLAALAYVALHGRATPEAIIDAVWAGTSSSNGRRRLSNVMSACRHVLGSQHLPEAANGYYFAGPRLMTDTELFDRRVAHAATQPRREAAATLQGALDLIEGKIFICPYATLDGFSWIELENLHTIWDRKITDVADTLIDLHLDAGGHDAAIAVATSILTVLPANTKITEQLMRAHHAAGDRLAVQRTYKAHLSALQTLGLDEPEESTADLAEALIGKHPVA